MPSSSTGLVSEAISAHGTLVYRNGTQIGELRDITPPPLTRNPIETTSQNSSDDSYVVGVRRKGELTFNIGFLPSGEATHNSLAGLVKAWHDGSNDLYLLEFPDTATWQFSGFVTNIAPSAPVDGGLEAAISIRPSGGHIFLP
jgi:Lambda phage tail tube protein, TTP